MNIIQKLQEELTVEKHKLYARNEEQRIEIACNRWWSESGHIPAHIIAKAMYVTLEKMTVRIQQQMRERSGVEIPNDTPKVEVCYTEEQIDKLCPSMRMMPISFDLELFYYLANPNPMPEAVIDATPEITESMVKFLSAPEQNTSDNGIRD